MARSDKRDRIAAGLTLFRPDRAIFDPLLSQMIAETDRVFVVVDGLADEAVDTEYLRDIEARPGVSVLPLRENAGIACGLNRLMEAAHEAGFDRLVLFDQDSEPEPGLVARLGEGLTRLSQSGHRPAALGPCPVAALGSGTLAPLYRRRRIRAGRHTSVDFIIVSGSLLDVGAFKTVGPFCEALRMDGVDLEWGFRAWARGHSVWVDEESRLPHRVGTGVVRFGPVAFPRQSEARMANYVCSQARLLRMRHVPVQWKLRSLFYLPLQIFAYCIRSGDPRAHSRQLLAAAWQGLAARP